MRNICLAHLPCSNFSSVLQSLRAAQFDISIIKHIEESHGKPIIFPGNSSFKSAVNDLKNFGISTPTDLKICPSRMLFICSAFHALHIRSNEDPITCGIGFITDSVIKLPSLNVGFRRLKSANSIYKSLSIYHLHHYYSSISTTQKSIKATIQLGHCNTSSTVDIPSIFQEKNVIGIQGHPELSSLDGITLIKHLLFNLLSK